MRQNGKPWIALTLLLALAGATAAKERPAATRDPRSSDLRAPVDTVGFVTEAASMDSVLAQCRALAAPRRAQLIAEQGWDENTPFVAAVCPHDDYAYAGRLYELLRPHLTARTVILFGVFHKARLFDCRDRIVFDGFEAWHGPYGPVKVSELRDELIARLPSGDILVDDEMHGVEHSLEAIVPWLQSTRQDVEILPILVPYMEWETLDRLAGEVSDALVSLLEERGWILGRDVAIVASADAIHYGDAGWGGRDYADFGTGPEGYARAVQRDRELAASTLAGPVQRDALRRFLYRCVDSTDVTRYRLTWCGRFSVPFGLNVASRLSETLAGRPLEGAVLDYGTSVGEISLDLEAIPHLGVTAPNHLHHWVGYASIGYR